MRTDGTCRSCGAPIRWAVHETTGRRMPLNPVAVSDGNVVVVDWQHAPKPPYVPIVAVGDQAIPRSLTGFRYTSHFATCPNAHQHRRTP